MADAGTSRISPWSGLIAGAIAWSAQHQLLADWLHFDCVRDERALGLITGLAAAALAAGGAAVSLRATRQPDRDDLGARRFIGMLSAMAAGTFLFAIVLQTLAAFLLPGCRG
jgi:hypothetical protein